MVWKLFDLFLFTTKFCPLLFVLRFSKDSLLVRVWTSKVVLFIYCRMFYVQRFLITIHLFSQFIKFFDSKGHSLKHHLKRLLVLELCLSWVRVVFELCLSCVRAVFELWLWVISSRQTCILLTNWYSLYYMYVWFSYPMKSLTIIGP